MGNLFAGMAARVKVGAILAAGIMAAAGTAGAATVTVTDGTGNNFDDTFGFAIDFDATTGLAADWQPDLTAEPYNIDNFTVYRSTTAAPTFTGEVRLGVYTTLTGSTLGGFQGVSSNTVTLGSLAASDPLTFNFSGIAVTPETNPGAGNDIRYFVFQTGETAITNYITQGTAVPYRRIDGFNGQFADELAGVLGGNSATATLRTDRVPEYTATLSAVPEPSALGLLGASAAALASRRRRQR